MNKNIPTLGRELNVERTYFPVQVRMSKDPHSGLAPEFIHDVCKTPWHADNVKEKDDNANPCKCENGLMSLNRTR
jgi:hypothetical protein